ncbi:TIGR02281 family clan AA aspartic protease [Pseudomonas sp. LTJR-52]|uniref:retropepsin-like aspartic protease family protein n=1 Tax=Pseudomonas sp. LTJR-52 TaxID=2479392 RepID=UPI000EFCFE45|nr:TIGR02281 family clan AA aspartic protease [Pseudomonas sp. LTJR-52]AYN95898.1 TIGR02281 family clan AA aspartic protease [Pseudomonas sp. LTJR-52]
MVRKWIDIGVLSLLPALVTAAPQVQVVGLFNGAAVINIDGQRKMLKVGQRQGEVELVSATSREAVLRIGETNQTFMLSREYSDGFAAPHKRQLSIARRNDGHYWTSGSINGQPIEFLIDTGASTVAMNEEQANRLGLDYQKGRPVQVNTAGGTRRAWLVRLDRVKVGTIEVLGVEAMVLAGGHPTETLLGMSFLNRVGWREDQGVLYVEAKN